MREDAKIAICGLKLDEFAALVKADGEKSFRAKQIYRWVFGEGESDFSKMTDLSVELRARLGRKYLAVPCSIEHRAVSADGTTVKYAIRLIDGNIVETVKIYDDDGLDKFTICVSTQVGCPVNCAFCQTARMGFVRNLDAAEIVGQVLLASFDDGKKGGAGLSNIVYMGMGEPLMNYDSVVKSVRIINDPAALGVSMRKITISTAGVEPMMMRLMGEDMPVTLALSLHAPTDTLREKLVPLNKKYGVKTLIKALKSYVETTGRRVTVEYVLIDGVNDKKSDARKLAELLKGLLCHVNLIPMNKTESVYGAPSKAAVAEFKSVLLAGGVNATVRSSRGQDINAACGMLYKDIKKFL